MFVSVLVVLCMALKSMSMFVKKFVKKESREKRFVSKKMQFADSVHLKLAWAAAAASLHQAI